MWHNRVRLNARVAEIAATQGKYKVKLREKSDLRLKWLASQSSGLQYTMIGLALFGIPALLVSEILFCRLVDITEFVDPIPY